VAEGPGVALQREIRRQVLTLLGRLRDQVEAIGALAGLGPAGPEWASTALDGRLLARLDQLDLPDPLATAVLGVVRSATGGQEGVLLAAIHGWQDGEGGPRGIALAGRVGAPGAGGLVFAVHVTPSGTGPLLGLTASGVMAQAARIPLSDSFSLTVFGQIGGTLGLTVDPTTGDVARTLGSDGDRLRIDLERTADLRPLGVPGGPGVVLGPAAFGAEVVLNGGRIGRRVTVRLPQAALRLAPAALARLVPAPGPLAIDLDIGFDGASGMTFGGSSQLQVRVPVEASFPGGRLESVDLAIRLVGNVGSGLELAVGARVTARISLPGAPIELSLSGLGLELPFGLGDVPVRGLDPARIADLPATGAGVDVALPIVRAGGFLAQTRPGEYSGALSASVPPMSAAAFAVLGTSPMSFVVLLSATFPPPGIQIGFGFAVSGIGGVVGVGRRVDRAALLRAVADGSAAQLLFPTDPAAAAGQVGGSLAALFPPARGGVLAGPMFQLSWGGRIATASVAVLLEVAPSPRMTVIGTLVLALPDPAAPLVLIQVAFAGLIDPAEPSVLVVASMHGSHLLGMPITGDVCLLTRGGPNPTFVLSAGGFHPAFPLPRGVPPLARIGMDLSPLPLLELRSESYFAITSNTVQFGARVELVAEVAECGLRGHLGLDVLIQLDPFRFVASVSIGIALTVFGEELVGVALDLTLEGPAPWRARGRGSIDLFLFSVSFDFDEQWGSAPALPRPAPDVGHELRQAISAPSAWVVHRSTSGVRGIVVNPDADRLLGRGAVVDPYGALSVRQRRVPLGVSIDRFDRIPLPDRQSWNLVDGRLGDVPSPDQSEVREPFAAAAYLALSDDQQLSRPAYEPFRAGIDLVAAGVLSDPLTPHTITVETTVVADPVLPSVRMELGELLALSVQLVAASASIEHPLWWTPDQDRQITVAEQTPLTVASAWAMAQPPVDVGPSTTATELFEVIGAIGRPDLMVVEAWEMGS